MYFSFEMKNKVKYAIPKLTYWLHTIDFDTYQYFDTVRLTKVILPHVFHRCFESASS